jgi:hypothetical protein
MRIEGSLAGKISYGRICISGFELLTWYGCLHFPKTILVVVDSVPAHGEAYMLTCQSRDLLVQIRRDACISESMCACM